MTDKFICQHGLYGGAGRIGIRLSADDPRLLMGHFHQPKRFPLWKRFRNWLLGKFGVAPIGMYVVHGSCTGRFSSYDPSLSWPKGAGQALVYTPPVDNTSRLFRHGSTPIPISIIEMDFADVEKAVLAHIAMKKLNVLGPHYKVEVREQEAYVTGTWEAPDRSVGIMCATFDPDGIYDLDGNHLPELESSLTGEEWEAISLHVEEHHGDDNSEPDFPERTDEDF
jgi:hypothetical protein